MLFGFHISVLILAMQILCIYFYINMEYVCTCIDVHILAPRPCTPAAFWPRGGAVIAQCHGNWLLQRGVCFDSKHRVSGVQTSRPEHLAEHEHRSSDALQTERRRLQRGKGEQGLCFRSGHRACVWLLPLQLCQPTRAGGI